MSHQTDPLAILKTLIAIPSVNPMGRNVSGPEFFETRVSEFLVGFFKQLEVAHEIIDVAPGRSNVLARFDSAKSQTTVLMDAHQDTVPVDGMTIDPFDPVERDGKLFGRGACDVKGGMAGMLAAFARLVQEKPPTAANVVLSCTCDEEATITGLLDLIKLWTDPHRSSRLLSQAPTVAVVAEPTEMDVVVAHRGATRWKIRTAGRACHSSKPTEGVNAIYRMAAVLKCLEEYANQLANIVAPHPLCGSATLSVGRIEGGVSVNVVPDECTIEIDRRVIPGEDGSEVIDHVAEFLRSKLDFDVEFLPPWNVGVPLPDDNNKTWADRLLEEVEPIAGTHQKVGVPYGTHASRIAASGVPAMVFGPGSIDQAHTVDEWISIEQLHQASDVYYHFAVAVG